MKARVVLITGANTGIGKATAMELARQGATVVITARHPRKAAEAQHEIKAETGNQQVDLLLADFASFAQVRRLAAEFRLRYERLDVLVNNAGLVLSDRRESEDGNEMTVQVNHLAHFLLTYLLLDRLKASAPARIINVSALLYRLVRDLPLTAEGLKYKEVYFGFQAYARNKLANILFTRKLARLLEGSGVTVNALHPGVVRTDFGRHGDVNSGIFSIFSRISRLFMLSPEKGARTSVYLAVSKDVEGITGKYFHKCQQVQLSQYAQDDRVAEEFWRLSEKLTGVT